MALSSTEFYGTTDVGLVREMNEDTLLTVEEKGFYAVFDGMGGHAAGNVASFAASNIVLDLIKGEEDVSSIFSKAELSGTKEIDEIVNYIKTANRGLYNLALRYPALRGMGTTAVVCMISRNLIHIANVGDSRLYRLRDKKLELLTVDHSWVNEMIEDHEITAEEAYKFKRRNVITRVLGIRPKVKVDLKTETMVKGDIYLICSDGLTSNNEDEAIEAVMNNSPDKLDEKCAKLIELANSSGGDDNATVVLVRVNKMDYNKIDGSVILGKVGTFAEESEELLAQEDALLKKVLKRIDFNGFNKDLFKRPTLISRKAALSALAALIIPVFAYFLWDISRSSLFRNMMYGIKDFFSETEKIKSSSDDRSDEGKKTRNATAAELKLLIPDSTLLEIKKPK